MSMTTGKPPGASQLHLLAEQRGRLLERIAQQRAVLQVQWAPLQRTADQGDRVIAAARGAQRYVQAHRATFTLALAVTCAAFVLVKPGRSFRLLKRGFVVWRGWRALQSAQVFVPGSLWATAFNLIRRRFLPAVAK